VVLDFLFGTTFSILIGHFDGDELGANGCIVIVIVIVNWKIFEFVFEVFVAFNGKKSYIII
jgi:hypothetical protein